MNARSGTGLGTTLTRTAQGLDLSNHVGRNGRDLTSLTQDVPRHARSKPAIGAMPKIALEAGDGERRIVTGHQMRQAASQRGPGKFIGPVRVHDIRPGLRDGALEPTSLESIQIDDAPHPAAVERPGTRTHRATVQLEPRPAHDHRGGDVQRQIAGQGERRHPVTAAQQFADQRAQQWRTGIASGQAG